MPKVALSDTLRDWQDLLTAAEERAPEVKGLGLKLEVLRQDFERLQELEALRKKLKADRQEATQQLHAVRERGKDHAIGVRALLQAAAGHRNQGLVRYGIHPRRPLRAGEDGAGGGSRADSGAPQAGGEA